MGIDDHTLFSDALSLTLTTHFHNLAVTQCDDARQALQHLSQGQNFDLIILDLAMPGIDGLGFVESYAALYANIPILVCSGSDDINTLQQLRQKGVCTYLSKSQPASAAVSAVQATLAGDSYYPPHLQTALGDSTRGNSTQGDTGTPAIPERQLAILRLIKVGHSNQQIADLLHISPNTVKTHIRLLYDRLDARNRQDCLLKAEQFKLQ